jgi:16S rRNA processing protein RimM
MKNTTTINASEELISAGYVKKSHGVKGGLLLLFDDDVQFTEEEVEFLFLEIDGLPVPFPVEYLEERDNNLFYAELAFLNSKESVQAYSGCNVLFEKKNIAAERGEISISHLEGFLVTDPNMGEIGRVCSVDDFSGNIVLTVTGKNGEYLIPYNEDFVVSFDTEKLILEMNCPEGIFE